MGALHISEASKATGLPATTLRYWERIGLIGSSRTDAGYRVFDDRAIERLRFISAAKRLDLPLEAIRELVHSRDDEACRSVKRRWQPMVRQRLTHAEDGIAELTALIHTLRAGLASLDRLPDRDRPCDEGCSVLGPAGQERNATVQPVIACSLTATDHAARLGRWHGVLAAAQITRDELVTTVKLDSGRAADVAELIRDEQDCCPFLAFRLDFHGSTTELTITAPNTTAEPFVDALLPSGVS